MSDQTKDKRVVIFNQRRRRKRNRSQLGSAKETKKRVYDGVCTAKDDDDMFAFLDKDGDDLQDGAAQFRSLPILLEERRRGRWQCKCTQWQSQMLFNFTKKPANKLLGRRQWRPYANNRIIKFTELGSPPSDAVLALEHRGDYMLSLGSLNNSNHSGLAIRFYGICNDAGRKRQNRRDDNRYPNNGTIGTAPLLQTIPLHRGIQELNQFDAGGSVEEEIITNLQRHFSPSTTPVEILISKDWKMGVALVHQSTATNVLQLNNDEDEDYNVDADQTASMILFTLPRRQYTVDTESSGRIFECKNVPMFCNDNRRKCLWLVQCIPNKDDLCTYFRVNSGYLVLHDEGDGFRLTWASEKYFLASSCLEDVSAANSYIFGRDRVSATSVDIISQQSTSWVETYHDAMTGKLTTTEDSDQVKNRFNSQVSIVHESFLHVDILLNEILCRRKGISETQPDFCYSLIAVNHGGRIVEFVIVFASKKKSCSLGIFVKVDLLSGFYAELDWVQSKERKQKISLQKWSNKLALNTRMKKKRAGPFSVDEKNALDCTQFVSKETFKFDNDEEDDYDESYWREFVSGTSSGKARRRAPKLVTPSSLYPSCDIVTNLALLKCDPVHSIRAKNSPIQLVYN